MNYKKGTQTRRCLKSVMRYVSQLSKTLWDGQQLVNGNDECLAYLRERYL